MWTPSEGEGLWFVFRTCEVDCGNVLRPCQKVIGTGPTVLTTSWVCAILNGVPWGRSVRTPTVRRWGLTGIYGYLRGFTMSNGDVQWFTRCDGVLRDVTGLYVSLGLFEVDLVKLVRLPLGSTLLHYKTLIHFLLHLLHLFQLFWLVSSRLWRCFYLGFSCLSTFHFLLIHYREESVRFR